MKFFSKRKALREENKKTNSANKNLNLTQVDSSEFANDDGKQNSQKSKINRNKKIIKCILLGTITVALESSIVRTIYANNKSYFKNSDSISLVAKELSADMNIMQYDDQIFRLKPNDNRKISVFIDSSVPARTSQIIQESLDYFNDIFDKVNDRFNFTLSNKADYIADRLIQKSTIKFDYKTLDNKTYGVNSQYRSLWADLPVKIWADNSNDGKYCISSKISLNKTYFENIDDQMQQYVIRHEILHSLGFADVYNKSNTTIDTIMHTDNMYIINELSPNDMRRIYTAYCDDYMNDDKTINYEKLNEIKNILNKYETKYYDNLAQIFKKAFNRKCNKFSDNELKNFSASYGLLDVTINDDGKYEYIYNKNSINPNTRFTGNGKVLKGNDYAFLPNLNFRGTNDYYIVLKDNIGLNIYNFYLSRTTNDYNTYNTDIEYKSFIVTQNQKSLETEESFSL